MSYVTLVHHAKAVGRNEMPFGRATRVVQSNIVLDRGPRSHHGKRRFGGLEPQSKFALQNYGQTVSGMVTI